MLSSYVPKRLLRAIRVRRELASCPASWRRVRPSPIIGADAERSSLARTLAGDRPDRAADRPLSGDVRADVVVVGCGYTGLSAALHLAEAGAKVVALEARDRLRRRGTQCRARQRRHVGAARRHARRRSGPITASVRLPCSAPLPPRSGRRSKSAPLPATPRRTARSIARSAAPASTRSPSGRSNGRTRGAGRAPRRRRGGAKDRIQRLFRRAPRHARGNHSAARLRPRPRPRRDRRRRRDPHAKPRPHGGAEGGAGASRPTAARSTPTGSSSRPTPMAARRGLSRAASRSICPISTSPQSRLRQTAAPRSSRPRGLLGHEGRF